MTLHTSLSIVLLMIVYVILGLLVGAACSFILFSNRRTISDRTAFAVFLFWPVALVAVFALSAAQLTAWAYHGIGNLFREAMR